MAQPFSVSGTRAAKLFRNNRSQAVRIPAEFEFASSRVLIHKEGDKLIIEPEPKVDLVSILQGLAPLGPEDHLPGDLGATLLPLAGVEL